MIHASFCSGIGGFDLAAEWAGWQNAFICEIDPWCRQVLKKNFTYAVQYTDLLTADFAEWQDKIDVVSAGFPCQPYSTAGQRKGDQDSRHLWPHVLRAVQQIRPTWFVGENVSGLLSWSAGVVFEQIQVDLETEGYEVQAVLLPACGVNAPHKRERIWFVAHRSDAGAESVRFGGKNSVHGPVTTTNASSGQRSTEQPLFAREPNLQGCSTPDATSIGGDSGRQRTRRETGPNAARRGARSAMGNATVFGRNDGLASQPGQHQQSQEQTGRSDTPTDDANPNGAGCQSHGKQLGEQVETRTETAEDGGSRHRRTDWSGWPTQSPLCAGNDGLSPRLVRLANRQRNNAIKGAGNAIVPQVALQIFQAINQYRQLPT